MLTSLLNRRVMAERYGTEEPRVLALHGWGRSRHDWAETLPGLDALALDLPGFGATPAPTEAWSVSDYARLFDPLLDEASPRVLVGHSFGGRIAVRMAAANPRAVRGLVLTGVPLLRVDASTARSPFPYRIIRALHARGMIHEELIERARQRYGSADYRSASGAMRGVLVKAVNEDYSDSLQALRDAAVPVALIWGERDASVPASVPAAAKSLLGSLATVDYVAGSAHLLDGSLSRRVRAAIDAMIDPKNPAAPAGDRTPMGST